MTEFRREHDLLGEMDMPHDALHGIHTARAVLNFPLSGRCIHTALIHAYGAVKLACAQTNHELGRWDEKTFSAITEACREMSLGRLDSHILVDALQGGAGTSTNMNVNEVLANRALQILGCRLGDYAVLHPLEDINLHQSTNDTYPTALRVAAIQMLHCLEAELVGLLESFQRKEKEFANIVKVGRTECQDAVLTTLGRSMSCYAEAFGRDRWRISKCEERLRVVNLGGTAIGTGLSAPRKYIFRVVENLRGLTGLGLARAENLVEATQNTDAFAEVSGILNACAINLMKVSGDLRLLSSGPDAGIGELQLPPCQAGSSIMPGKVNPVIPEAVTQAAIASSAHHNALCNACGSGSLELNAFMPLIADSLLTEIGLLTNACKILRTHCVDGLAADAERCRQHVDGASAILTALLDSLGYEEAQELAREAKEKDISIKELVLEKKLFSSEELSELLSPETVTRLGRQAP